MLSRTDDAPVAARRFCAAPAFAILLTASASIADGVAYRVEDIDTTPPGPATMHLQGLLPLGDVALAAPAAVRFPELPLGGLWTTDGTAAGTRIFRDLQGRGTREAVALGGGALLVAHSPATGEELWWTDGTTLGTRFVRDIDPGPSSSMPVVVGVLGDVALLAADDGVHGRELWRSNGTTGATYLLAEVRAGAAGGLPEWDDPDRTGVVFDGRLYFAPDDGVRGRELWRSDGHPEGTSLFKNLVPGATGGSPRRFRTAAGRLLFVADDPAHGAELWSSDGTGAGTAMVVDLEPGAVGSDPVPLGRVAAGLVFFAAAPAATLWVSDGTAAGTMPIAGVPATDEGVKVGSRVIFVADEPGLGRMLWVTDGTNDGTHRVSDDPNEVGQLRAAGGFAIFLAGSPEVGRQLWRTDGTAAGTFVLGDGADLLSTPVAAGEEWIYSACDYGVHGWLFCQFERTDGTPAGTGPIPFPSTSSSAPRHLTPRDHGVVFSASPGTGGRPAWGSDGTETGTLELDYTGVGSLTLDGSGAPLADGEAVVSGLAGDVEGVQVFRTDGGFASVLGPFEYGPRDPLGFVRVGGHVFFAADSLWKTDGTTAGTVIVRRDLAGWELTDVFGKLWLVESDLSGATLWESAGTAETTIPHPLDLPAGSGAPEGLLPVDPPTGSFAFRAGGGVYLFDPIADQAIRLHDLSPTAPPLYEPWPRAAAAGALFFFDGNPDGNCALWKSDGTPAGTLKLKNVGVWGCWPLEIVAMGDLVYFRGCDAARGCELWRSDGTTAGTVRFSDLDPGPFSSMPGELAVVGDRLYFSACDPAHGCEPWVTAGTPASTHRLGDIAPGKDSSRLEQLTAAFRLVFFQADDGTGSELWAVPQEIFYDGFETGDTTRW